MHVVQHQRIAIYEYMDLTWRPRGLSKSAISRVIIRVTQFRLLMTLLITHSLSPLGLQVRKINGSSAISTVNVVCFSSIQRC